MKRIRYNKASDAPKLSSAVIALGVNGVTKASTDAELLVAINQLQDDTASYTNTETNSFLEAFANKVLISKLFKRMKFKDPLTAKFFKQGTSYSGAKEIFDSKLLGSHNFDSSKRFPDKQTKAENLNTILTTAVKAYITNTIQVVGLKAAFASELAYGEFMVKQIDLISESLQVILFETLSPTFEQEVKNIITIPQTVKTWDDIFVAINGIAENMKLPTKKYNLGFADGAAAKTSKLSRTNITPMSDLVLLGSTNIENALKGKVSTVKFHNSYFKLTKYNAFIALDMGDDEIFMIDKRAAEGYFRVNQMATQHWAGNLTIEYFLHYWFVFGFIPWANGVRIKFTTPV